eukprot:g31.t1
MAGGRSLDPKLVNGCLLVGPVLWLLSSYLDLLHVVLLELLLIAVGHTYLETGYVPFVKHLLPPRSNGESGSGAHLQAPDQDPPPAAAAVANEEAEEDEEEEEEEDTQGDDALALTNPYATLCDQMVEEFMANAEGRDGVWDPVASWESEGLGTCEQKKGFDVCFRTKQRLPNTAATCFSLVNDVKRRKEWDSSCDELRIVEIFDPHTAVIYYKSNPIWPTSSRDVVMLSHKRCLEGGAYLSVTKSIVHRKCPELTDGTVRAEMGVAGQMCTPIEGSSSESLFTAVTNLDPKGYIPPMVVKIGINKKTPAGMRVLKKMTTGLEAVERWVPPKLEDAPPEIRALISRASKRKSKAKRKKGKKAKKAKATQPGVPSSAAGVVNPYATLCDQMVAAFVRDVGNTGAASNEASDGDASWEPVASWESEGLGTCEQRKGSSVCFRTKQRLPNTAATCFSLVNDVKRRKEWDSSCDELRIVEIFDPHTAVIYYKSNPIWPTSSRDVVMLSHKRCLEGGAYLSVTKSIVHRKCPELTDGTVRAEMGVAGQMCTPIEGSSSESLFTAVTNLDPKGYIPPMVVKIGINKKMPAGMRALKEMVAGLEAVERWVPPKLEDAPPEIRALIATPADETDEDEEDDDDDPDNDDDDEQDEEESMVSQPAIYPPSGGGQLVTSQPSGGGPIRSMLEHYEPYIVGAIAVLTVYNTVRRGRLR